MLEWRLRGLGMSAARVESLQQGPDPRDFVRVCTEPAYIEPAHGFIVTEQGRLLEDSVEPGFDHVPVWRYHTPSARDLYAKRRVSSNVRHYPALVSMRHLYEWNYYHFHLDVLGKLEALDRAGVPRDVPLVFGRYIHRHPYTRELLQMGQLGQRPSLFPDKDDSTIFRAERIYYVGSRASYAKRIHAITTAVGAQGDPAGSERLFLTRTKPAARCLLNADEIHGIARELGFAVVDTEGMPMAEQIGLFQRARYVVALHGAGVTNILYRYGQPCSLLELSAEEFIGPGDMQRICDELGFAYHFARGRAERGVRVIHADFSLAADVFRRAVDQLLTQ